MPRLNRLSVSLLKAAKLDEVSVVRAELHLTCCHGEHCGIINAIAQADIYYMINAVKL